MMLATNKTYMDYWNVYNDHFRDAHSCSINYIITRQLVWTQYSTKKLEQYADSNAHYCWVITCLS